MIVPQNIDLFRSFIEAKQNNQFELVNENIRGLTTIVANHIDESHKQTNQVLKSIINLKDRVDIVYNHYVNNSDLAKNRDKEVQQQRNKEVQLINNSSSANVNSCNKSVNKATFNTDPSSTYNFCYADRGWSNYHHSDWEPFIPSEPSNTPSHTPPPLAPLQNFAPPPSLAPPPS